jgi:flagellar biogenesis protein FliO
MSINPVIAANATSDLFNVVSALALILIIGWVLTRILRMWVGK